MAEKQIRKSGPEKPGEMPLQVEGKRAGGFLTLTVTPEPKKEKNAFLQG